MIRKSRLRQHLRSVDPLVSLADAARKVSLLRYFARSLAWLFPSGYAKVWRYLRVKKLRIAERYVPQIWRSCVNPKVPRLYVDVSHTSSADLHTGIQRVVRNVVQSLYSIKWNAFEPAAVRWDGHCFRMAHSWIASMGLPCNSGEEASDDGVLFQKNDVLLMLDASWHIHKSYKMRLEEVKMLGVKVVTAVYDLVPIHLPQHVDRFLWPIFHEWLRQSISLSSYFVCISKASAKELRDYIVQNNLLSAPPQIGYWHLGADFQEESPSQEPQLINVLMKASPYLIMVGTIEPRKSHALAIDAFEVLWRRDSSLNLCIAGRIGWKVEMLEKRLRTHPLLQERLFFFEQPSDAELLSLYKGASGLLFLSQAEGFGLPLIEAAHHGVPLVCSDIPVFREIAGEFATYIKLGDAASAADQLEKWWERRQTGDLPDVRQMPYLTWEESTKALVDLIKSQGMLEVNT